MILDTETVSMLTLVPPRQLPRNLTRLNYLSLALSTFIFILALINVVRNPPLSLPNVVAFALTIPYNATTIVVARRHARQPTVTPPLTPTTWKGLIFACLLVGLWIYGLVVDILHLSKSLGTPMCTVPIDDDESDEFSLAPCGRRAKSMTMPFFIVLTAVGAIQVFLMSAIVVICAQEKRAAVLASRARQPSSKA
ncbi:hypothetical protein BDZ94DRAFT_604056 [Collybia nuda]|uniref:Uncharacterized protein n=1 Tax=Collybia nuda TaxID=64659 RepID=A0A9P6CK77_9AGAR|nr:hypothetical protein BDZ94DRAFT_604056 [Collybia nuda]